MNLLKALLTVSGMTMISRVFGFIRDVLIARTFGAGLYTDAFFVAFRLPNLLRGIFGEGAFSQAFVPILAEYKTRRGDSESKELVDHVAALLGLLLMIVTVAGILAAPLVILATAPGFHQSPGKFQLTVELLRITFPYILFISLTSLAGGILNSYGKFAIPALAPTLLNLAFIAFTLWLAPYFDPPVKALAWAVFAGGLLQLGFQLPYLKKLGMLPRPRLNLKDPGVWRVLKLMGPAVFGVSIGQISLVINMNFASFLVTGSVSWLYYADRLMEFPTGVLGVAVGTILLPSLSKNHSKGDPAEFSRLLDWGLRITLLLTLPCALALALLATPLVSVLFYHGVFSAHDVVMTAQAVMAYALGLLGLVLVKVLAPGFYAKQDIKTPVKIGIVTLLVTQVFNLTFTRIFPLGHVGLALAVGLGACLNATLLYLKLRSHQIYRPDPGWGKFSLKLLVGLAALGTVLWLAAADSQVWLGGGKWAMVLQLSWTIALGAVAYFAALWAVGIRPRDFARRAI
ncbi:MAG: murein biosynthesis integral membrane protein MurJ [Betaproteobacteria bacterium]|nr:murein biosynthesis integral membrane protein MurJ [Betaproteobacteria bacterium]